MSRVFDSQTPRYFTTNGIVQVEKDSQEWSSGLTSCSADKAAFPCICCCPRYYLFQAHQAAMHKSRSITHCEPCDCTADVRYYGATRAIYGIQGDECSDSCAVWCCPTGAASRLIYEVSQRDPVSYQHWMEGKAYETRTPHEYILAMGMPVVNGMTPVAPPQAQTMSPAPVQLQPQPMMQQQQLQYQPYPQQQYQQYPPQQQQQQPMYQPQAMQYGNPPPPAYN